MQAHLGNLNIRIFNGYGHQEGSNKDNILHVWHEIEKQTIIAKDEGCGVLLEVDANAKLGCNIIENDPNPISSNGQILFDMIVRQNLMIGNLSSKCKGLITRHRSTVDKDEKAVIDYLLYCEQMEPFLNTMMIDEPRHHVLKKYVTRNGF